MTCTHEGFHSGVGHYDRPTSTLRYVMVCDDCHAEIAQLMAEPYTPAFQPSTPPARPTAGVAGRADQGASGAALPSAENSAS